MKLSKALFIVYFCFFSASVIPQSFAKKDDSIQAWNWGAYLTSIQKSLPEDSQQKDVMDYVMSLIKENKTVDARKYLLELSTDEDYQNDSFLNFLLGFFYEVGIGENPEESKIEGKAIAFKYMEQSAMGGYPEAQYRLGLYYRNGIGVEQDIGKAAKWYKKAALMGQENAIRNLKLMFLEGELSESNLGGCNHLNLARKKLIEAKRYFNGYTDKSGKKVNPNIDRALTILDEMVPQCVQISE